MRKGLSTNVGSILPLDSLSHRKFHIMPSFEATRQSLFVRDGLID